MFRNTILMCEYDEGAKRIIWEYKRNEKSLLPYSDNEKSSSAIHENFPQQQKHTLAGKIAAWKKSRVGKNTIFSICLPLRYKFRIRDRDFLSAFSLQLFFHPATT